MEVVAVMEMVPIKGTSRREMMMPDNSRRRVTVSTAAAEHMSGAQPAAVERWAAAAETAAVNGDAAAAESPTATAKDWPAAPEAAAVNGSAAASEATTAAMKRRTAASKAAASTETATAARATPVLDFSGQGIGNLFRCRRGGRVDQRQRLGALAWQGQRQHCGSREAPAADEAAPGIWNRHH